MLLIIQVLLILFESDLFIGLPRLTRAAISDMLWHLRTTLPSEPIRGGGVGVRIQVLELLS